MTEIQGSVDRVKDKLSCMYICGVLALGTMACAAACGASGLWVAQQIGQAFGLGN